MWLLVPYDQDEKAFLVKELSEDHKLDISLGEFRAFKLDIGGFGTPKVFVEEIDCYDTETMNEVEEKC